MDFTLQRVAVRPDGCFSVLKEGGYEGEPFAVTLERTYDLKEKSVVAEPVRGQLVKIPVGRWKCVPRFYNKGGYETYEILVPGHTALLFHKGNVEAHSEGCVLVGETFSKINGIPGVLDGSGLTELFKRINGRREFILTVEA